MATVSGWLSSRTVGRDLPPNMCEAVLAILRGKGGGDDDNWYGQVPAYGENGGKTHQEGRTG